MTPSSLISHDELIVVLGSHPGYFSAFNGTRAMLEAEVSALDGIEWPEKFCSSFWSDEKFRYWLRRKKPVGAKGHPGKFATVDWWCLGWDLVGTSISERRIQTKAQELRDEVYRHSAKGITAGRIAFERYCAAVGDERFLAFKALVPGLVQPKRGRRAKNDDGTKSVMTSA